MSDQHSHQTGHRSSGARSHVFGFAQIGQSDVGEIARHANSEKGVRRRNNVKRIIFTLGFLGLGLFISTATVLAQGGTPGEGFPPASDLYNDAVLVARFLPLVAALGIGFGIWYGKIALRQAKSTPNSSTIIRHDWGSVTGHWTNGIGFIIGMVTGAIALRWLPRPDDMRIIFALHYIGSSLIIFGVASHLTQHGITGGFGLIPRSFQDLISGLGEMVEYAGVYGSDGAVFRINLPKGLRDTFADTFRAFGLRPAKQIGKYLPAEKVFSYTPWAIIISVIVVTGLIKAFRYLYPIPPTFIAGVSTLHDWFAAASIVMFGIHLAALFLVPRHWTLVVSMLTTRIPRSYAEKYHPLWLKDLVAKEQAAASSASPAASTAQAASQSKA
jgi:cytochrome b subunit of formate dehydrogenase